MARQRGSQWQASVTDSEGNRHRPAFPTEAKAVAWEQAARAAILEGRPIPPTATGVVNNVSLTELGSLFSHVKRTHWTGLKSAETLIRNGQDVVDYFGTKKDVGSIRAADVDEFRATLIDKGLTASTANRKCAALSKMLRVAEENGALARRPKIKFSKEEQTKFRFVDDTEEAMILAYWSASGDPDLHDLTAFLLDTGARCYSEATTAHWDAFGPGFRSVTFWHTKTKRPRTVPLTSRCRAILQRRQSTMASRSGPFTGMRKDSMKHRWVTMRTALRLEDVTPHTMRHTCCTRLISAGVDVKRVMQWMGHTELTTTLRYMQIRPNGLDDIVALLEGDRRAA